MGLGAPLDRRGNGCPNTLKYLGSLSFHGLCWRVFPPRLSCSRHWLRAAPIVWWVAASEPSRPRSLLGGNPLSFVPGSVTPAASRKCGILMPYLRTERQSAAHCWNFSRVLVWMLRKVRRENTNICSDPTCVIYLTGCFPSLSVPGPGKNTIWMGTIGTIL